MAVMEGQLGRAVESLGSQQYETRAQQYIKVKRMIVQFSAKPPVHNKKNTTFQPVSNTSSFLFIVFIVAVTFLHVHSSMMGHVKSGPFDWFQE